MEVKPTNQYFGANYPEKVLRLAHMDDKNKQKTGEPGDEEEQYWPVSFTSGP